MDDVALLVNPAASRGRGRRVGAQAAALLRESAVAVRECVSTGLQDAERFARAVVADGCPALVVCGGDGIVHVALQAVSGTGTALGVIPAGSGNDFARACGIPLGDAAAAVQVVRGGHTVAVDLGVAAGRRFGTVLASGFDSRVTERMNGMTWPRGKARYHAALVAELAAFRPLPFELEVDGARREVEAMLVAVGNGSTYGGGMRICPAARTDDGLFDVTVITTLSRAKLIRLFHRVYPGTHVERPEVLTFQCSELIISAPAVTGFADGEYIAALPLTCTVERAAIRVLVP
jgi:diacylglycerol kinase (ATP)